MGQLDVAEGLRVQPLGLLWESIRERWGKPLVVTRLDRDRVLHYEATVPTIYGDMTVMGTAI